MRLGVHGPNRLHVEAHRDARRLGWSVVPLRGPDLKRECHRLDVDQVIGADEAWGRQGDHGEPGERVLLQTSGSTGEPAPVSITEAHLAAHRDACARRIGHDADSHWLLGLPLTHMGGIGVLDRCLRDECRMTLAEPTNLEAIWAGLRRVTHVSLVPQQLGRLLAGNAEVPPQLECVLVGGDAVRADLVHAALEAGWPLHVSYGLTEACGQVATATPADWLAHPGTVGRPLPGVEVSIGPGDEIMVSGPTVIGGGPHATGDMGFLDDDGYLFVTQRTSERIIIGGKNVDARRVEAVLLGLSGVQDCAVVGVSDEVRGQAVAALVEVDGSLDEAAATALCRRHLERHEIPRYWQVGVVPRDAQGKLRRRQVESAFTPR